VTTRQTAHRQRTDSLDSCSFRQIIGITLADIDQVVMLVHHKKSEVKILQPRKSSVLQLPAALQGRGVV
jgi:hypothetical protein